MTKEEKVSNEFEDLKHKSLYIKNEDIPNTGLLIGGEWSDCGTRNVVCDKYNGSEIAEVYEARRDDVARIVKEGGITESGV